MALRKAKLFRCLSISAKNNNKIYRLEEGEVFTEDQVNNFDELLAGEMIQLVEEIAQVEKAEAEIKPLPKSKKK